MKYNTKNLSFEECILIFLDDISQKRRYISCKIKNIYIYFINKIK